MFRKFLCLVLLANSTVIADDKFEFEDRGFRLRTRDGALVEESGGFAVKGENNGIPVAIEKAKIESTRQDSRYNAGVNRIGEAGHGVAYPLYQPVYQPVLVPVPVAVPAYAPYCSVSRARMLVPHCSVSRARIIAGPHYYPY